MKLTARLFFNLLQQSYQLFFQRIALWLSVLLPVLIPTILINSFIWHNQSFWNTVLNKTSLATFNLIDNAIYTVLALIVWIYWLALVVILRDTAKGEKVQVSKAYSQGIRFLFSDAWVKIIGGIKILWWSLFLIAPGVYKIVVYSLVKFHLIEGGKKGNAALVASEQSLEGNVIRYMDYGFFFLIITGGFFWVQLALFRLMYAHCILQNQVWGLRGIENIQIIVIGLTHVIVTIFMHKLYHALCDGSDCEERNN